MSAMRGFGLFAYRPSSLWCAVFVLLVAQSAGAVSLKPLSGNPRYFSDGTGKAIYMTGSHEHANLMDAPGITFDWGGYLNFLQSHNHNLIRLWTWEYAPYPLPWLCVSGTAQNCSRSDLNQFDPSYFNRLRNRIIDAGSRGVYVSVMLFEAWLVQNRPGSQGWVSNPFNANMNVNGINGDLNGDGYGLEIYTLANSSINQIQKAYVRQVIDTVNDLDNVLYEIVNEAQIGSVNWQYDMINYIHSYEAGKPKQHPVGMTSVADEFGGTFRQGSYSTLANSPADWVSPGQGDAEGNNWMSNPPEKAEPRSSSRIQTISGEPGEPWTGDGQLHRGINPILMDTALPVSGASNCCAMPADVENIRNNMGRALGYAQRMDLAHMPPRGDLCSTGFCLANAGQEYLVYLQYGGSATINLAGGASSFSVEWYNPAYNAITNGSAVTAGTAVTLSAPFGGAAILYMKGSGFHHNNAATGHDNANRNQ